MQPYYQPNYCNMKELSSVFLISLLLLLLNGCNLDELDFNKLSGDVDVQPTFVAPVAKGNITVWDMVNAANTENESSFSKDDNGLIKIIYKENNLFTYNISELLDFPASNTFSSGDQSLGDISPEDVVITKAINLQELSSKASGMEGIALLNGMTVPFPEVASNGMNAHFILQEITDFKNITLSKGSLKVQLKNKLKVPVTITGSLYDIDNNRAVADFSFTAVAPETSKSLSFPLDGTDLSNKIEFRMESFQTTGSSTPVTINLNDYINLTFSLTDLGISKGLVQILNTQNMVGSAGNFEFEFPQPDMKAFGAILSKGALVIKSVNNLPLSGVIHFSIPEIKNITTGVPVKADIPLDGSTVSIPLDNMLINFASDAQQPYNRIPYTYGLTINKSDGYINYSSTDAMRLEITLEHLEFQGVSGDFGKRSVQIDPGKFNLNVDMLDKIEGDFKLVNPTLVLSVRNSVGIPGTIAMNFEASNSQGQSVLLNPPLIDVPVPASMNAGMVTKNVTINKDNSNIVPFISLPPTGDISYSGKVDFNTSGTVTPQNPNFLDMGAAFGIDLAIEMPLELQVSNLEFKDTSAISGEDFENIETAELLLIANNDIPLDIDLQLLYVDTITGQQFGASKVARILSAAQVSPTGDITTVKSSHTFSLDAAEMQKLRKANGIVFSGLINSPNGGQGVAPLLSDSHIEMSVIVKSKVKLNF